MHGLKNNRFIASVVGTLVLMFGATAAHAVTYLADIHNGWGYSLVHEAPADVADQDDWLRFDAGETLTFDLNGLTLTASDPQSYDLASNNGATATLVIESMLLNLNDILGIPSGTIEYTLDGVAGTFTFLEQTYGNTPYNSYMFDGDELTVNLWGGDDANELGFDLRFTGSPVPVPPALWLFGSAVAALAMRRRQATG